MFRFLAGAKYFFLFQKVKNGSEAQGVSYIIGPGVVSSAIKRPEPPSSAEGKLSGAVPVLPIFAFMFWCA